MDGNLKESWRRGVVKRDIDLRNPSVPVSGRAYREVLEKSRRKADALGVRLILMDGTIEDYSRD